MPAPFPAMGLRTEHLGTLRDGRELMRVALELEPAEHCADAKPSWIHLLPGGSEVLARDGRRFTVESLDAIAANTELPLLIDWEHASESGDTRAAGWVEELKVEPATAGPKAGLWGRAQWTGKGTGHVRDREFRFLSPVVVGKRTGLATLAVEKLRSVALTNRPALRMHGIEAFTEQLSHSLGPIATETTDMDAKLRSTLATAFGLKGEVTDEQLAEAAVPIIESAKGGGAEAASLRTACAQLTADLSTERQAVATLTTELETHRTTSRKQAVEAFFDKGAREGKIAPAARDKWLAYALASAQNFETFKDVVYPGLVAVNPGRAPASRPGKRSAALRDNPHGINREALRSMGFNDKQIEEAEAATFSPSRSGPDDDDDDDDASDGDDGDDGDGDDDDDSAGSGDAAADGEGSQP